MSLSPDLAAFFAANDDRARDELFEFLRIPSVSARTEHNADTARAAEWFANSLRTIGLKTTVHETPGHPFVFGVWRDAPKDAPTILIYGN